MKTLLLIRHAKSSWEYDVIDFERPLNNRGKNDAPKMGQRLLKRKLKINAFISSPAKRARKTAEMIAKEMEFDEKNIIFKTELYHASSKDFYAVIASTDDEYGCIAVFSHNPGITELANELTDARIDNIPTCGIFAVQIQCDKWKDMPESKKEFLFFDYPKLV